MKHKEFDPFECICSDTDPKAKKPKYWVEIAECEPGYYLVWLCGRNKYRMLSQGAYKSKSRCVQQAKRLSKALGLEFRK